MAGSGEVPLTDMSAGQAELEYQGINLGAVAEQLLALPVPVRGSMSGNIAVRLPAVVPGEPRGLSVEVQVEAPRVDLERRCG